MSSEGSLRNSAIAEIQRRIIRGELGSGSTFSEAQLSSSAGFSRAPLREALAVLTELGWVSSMPRSGYIVEPYSMPELRELFTVRAQLEPRAAALAASTLRTLPDEAERLREFSHSDLVPSDEAWAEEHFRFHRRISVLSLNRELDRTMKQVLLKLERYLLLPDVRRSIADEPSDHRILCEALLAHDARAAADAAAVHIAQCQLRVTEALFASEALRATPLTERTAGLANGTNG